MGYRPAVGLSRRLTDIKETYEYVPLIPNLKALLSNSEVLNEVNYYYLLMHVDFFLFRYVGLILGMMVYWVTFVMVTYIRAIHYFLLPLMNLHLLIFKSSCTMMM